MDYPDYKYQPRRKKMKSMSGGGLMDEKQDMPSPPQPFQQQQSSSGRKSGRRSKKQQQQQNHQQAENGEMDDNSSEKGFIGECNMTYGVANYDNRTSLISNYAAYGSYMPPTAPSSGDLSQETFSSPHNQNNNYNDFYIHRKYHHAAAEEMHHLGGGNKISISSPASSSTEEHSMTSPETSISSTVIRTQTPPNGNFRELSPSLIASHAIMKDDYAPTVPETDECNNTDYNNSVTKYNSEPYRIYSHQLHHHHHYHYALQAAAAAAAQNSASSSSTSSTVSPLGYAYQGFSATSTAGIVDTDVDPKEMEQYLDSGKYRKLPYLKPEQSSPSLTELTPITSSSNESYHQTHKIDNENLMQLPTLEPIIVSNQPTATYLNGYQENSAYSTYTSGGGNWVNYTL